MPLRDESAMTLCIGSGAMDDLTSYRTENEEKLARSVPPGKLVDECLCSSENKFSQSIRSTEHQVRSEQERAHDLYLERSASPTNS